MRIIFSRKGFDSQAGGKPSPIIPHLGPLSLPIPSKAGAEPDGFRVADFSLADVIRDLAPRTFKDHSTFHLDPDLDAGMRSRRKGWRPAFGQGGSAQGHLSRHAVAAGDLFLFFGWFRHAEQHQGAWRYVGVSRACHAFFGWLQVDKVLSIGHHDRNRVPSWLRDHPHIAHLDHLRQPDSNTIYLAREQLLLKGGRTPLPGGGRFLRWSDKLKLSAGDEKKSLWSVPVWMDPASGRKPLSYHAKPDCWQRDINKLLLQTVARGQEFVLDADEYPEAIPWARKIIEQHASPVL